MPIYFYWGDDDFAIAQAVVRLRSRVLDPQWASFNFDKFLPDQADALVQALNQAMTPPFGSGNRLIWLVDTTLAQQCSEKLLSELERTLPIIPEASTLLLTSRTKPDGRLKSTKLLQKCAEIKEFPLISPWKTDQLVQQVRQVAQIVGVKLTSGAVGLLAQSVGNDTRQLYNELEKLRLYSGETQAALDEGAIATLVLVSTQNSLQLAAAIRDGKTALALELVSDLLQRNEPALRIVAVLVGQFRTWLWVKLMLEGGERDEKAIAQAAEVNNPNRIYHLKKEIAALSLGQLQQVLPQLLELELSLKQGAEDRLTLQTKVIEICQICQSV